VFLVQSSKSIADVDVFHELLEDVKKSGKLVKITACFDVESLAAGGLLFKVLKSMELDAEILPDYVPSITELNVRVLGVNIPHTECDACIVFQTSSEAQVSRLKNSTVVRYPSLLPGLINLLREFMAVSKELKYVAASATYAKYIPRIKELRLSEEDREFLSTLVSEGLLEAVEAPIIPYFTSQTQTLAMGIDPYVPSSLVRESLSETLRLLSDFYKAPLDKMKLKTYVIKYGWFVRDLTTLAYFLTWLLDVKGFEGYVSSVINSNYMRNYYLHYVKSIKEMKERVDSLISEKPNTTKAKNVVIRGDPSTLSTTLIGKVLWGLNVLDPSKTQVVIEYGGKYYVSLASLTQKNRRESASKHGIQGGYAVLGEVPS
jgi:hypothetical protein